MGEAGFPQIAEKLAKEKIIWFNLRQEPVAYIGGLPVAPRLTDQPHVNVEVSGSSAEVDAMEDKLVKEIASREKDGNVEHSDLKTMIAEGKDKLEWTRKVDQTRVEELRNKLSGPDFKEKLGPLVSDLYRL